MFNLIEKMDRTKEVIIFPTYTNAPSVKNRWATESRAKSRDIILYNGTFLCLNYLIR